MAIFVPNIGASLGPDEGDRVHAGTPAPRGPEAARSRGAAPESKEYVWSS